MTISKLHSMVGILLLSASTALVASAQTKSNQRPSLQLASPDVQTSAQRVRCRVDAVISTAHGIVLECIGQNGNGALLAHAPSADGTAEIGLAMMSDNAKPYRSFVVDKPGSAALKRCVQARRIAGNKPCFEVLAARISVKDSPINVGGANSQNSSSGIPTQDADADWPNIPTQGANPNGPDIPTQGASPD